MVKLDSNYLQELVKFGLSKHEIKAYIILLEKGSLSVREIAKEINVLPNALYRLLNKLVTKGLVSVSGNNPKVYNALPPSIALELLTKQKIKELEEAKNSAIAVFSKQKTKAQETTINLLKNKHEFFTKYLELAKQAKKEILVVSIGEPIPDEIKLVNRDAVARRVDFKMIAHKYDDENRNLLKSYKTMGWEIRHYPGGGFHLFVIDGMKSVLAVNNPKNTSERVAFQIFSRGLSKALQDYFYSIWEKAVEIN